MVQFEIYLAHHPWNGADYPRPWVIVDVSPNSNIVGCFPIATECYYGDCFFVSDTHPDFLATGLDHSCNVLDSRIVEIPGDKFIKRWGEFVGDLLIDFRAHTGIN
jgi:hypothetical protein